VRIWPFDVPKSEFLATVIQAYPQEHFDVRVDVVYMFTICLNPWNHSVFKKILRLTMARNNSSENGEEAGQALWRNFKKDNGENSGN